MDDGRANQGPDATEAAPADKNKARPSLPVAPSRQKGKVRSRIVERVAREKRRQLIVEMYLKRTPQTEIAQALGISQACVSYDIRAIEAEWRAARVTDLEVHRERELAELNHMEYLAGVREEVATADKRHAVAVMWANHRLACKDRKAKLMGLDAPKKVALETPEPLKIEYVNKWNEVKAD